MCDGWKKLPKMNKRASRLLGTLEYTLDLEVEIDHTLKISNEVLQIPESQWAAKLWLIKVQSSQKLSVCTGFGSPQSLTIHIFAAPRYSGVCITSFESSNMRLIIT